MELLFPGVKVQMNEKSVIHFFTSSYSYRPKQIFVEVSILQRGWVPIALRGHSTGPAFRKDPREEKWPREIKALLSVDVDSLHLAVIDINCVACTSIARLQCTNTDHWASL